MTPSIKFPAGLYGVTPDWDDAVRLEEAVRAAARGGMRALQLRHKRADQTQRLSLALHMQAVCKELGVVFMINDDWRLAQDIRADGVHLGRNDAEPALVRRAVGTEMLIGVSCYADPERAAGFLQYDVAYIAFGAMFASQTKPLAPPAPLSVLKVGLKLCQQQPAPRPAVVAIGGICLSNALQVAEAGADAIAVVGSLFLATDIEATARALAAPFSLI